MRYQQHLAALLLGVTIGTFGYLTVVEATTVPPRPGQPHPDIFQAPGFGNLQDLNPVTQKAKTFKAASYRLLLMSGCTAGKIPADLLRLEAEGKLVQFNLIRNDAAYDFTVRINCGNDQIRVCGSVNIYCLNRGFPYIADVDISDILSTYFDITRLSILLHEIIGHAVGTWNEQYCKGDEPVGNICFGLTLFMSAPGWHDFMNTGENSRHGIEAIERERWERTMYALAYVDPCLGETDHTWGGVWNSCISRWVGPDGWSFDPATGIWWNPAGQPEWGQCQPSWDGCWNIPTQRWVGPGSVLFNPVTGIWSSTPR